MFSHIDQPSKALLSYLLIQTTWGLVQVIWSLPKLLQCGPVFKITSRQYPLSQYLIMYLLVKVSQEKQTLKHIKKNRANVSYSQCQRRDSLTYLQGHHALLIKPDFGRCVPGAAQECPKLPRWQSADWRTAKVRKLEPGETNCQQTEQLGRLLVCLARPTCVFVTLESEQGLRSVQCEDAYVVIIPTCGDESSGICFTGCDHTHAGYEVWVARHAVRLCEAFVWAVKRRAQSNRHVRWRKVETSTWSWFCWS